MPDWPAAPQPIPEGLWADEFRSMGGITFQDAFGMQQEADAERQRAMAEYDAQMQAQAEAQRRAAQEAQYAQAEAQFVDWPTYQGIVQDKVAGRGAWEEYVEIALPQQLQNMGYTPDEIQEAVRAFAMQVPRPGEDKDFFGNLWSSLSGGAQSGTRGMQAYGNMENVDEIARLAAAQGGAAGEDVYPLQQFNRALAGIQPGSEEFDWAQTWDAVKTYAGAAFDNPEGALNWAAQQMAQSYPSLAASLAGMGAGLIGGPVGAVGGGMAGAFTASSALEAGSQILERVQVLANERGINMNDAAAVTEMLKEPGVYDAIRQAASSKGLAVGAADALVAGMSMGLGTMATRAARAGRRLKAGAYAGAGVVGEPIGSAVGEAVSQRVAGDPYSYSDIVGEAFGDVTSGAIHTGAGALLDRVTGGPLRPNQPPPEAPPEPELEEGDLAAANRQPLLLPAPTPGAPSMQNNVPIAMGQIIDAAEQDIKDASNPLFDVLDRVSPGWREGASAQVEDPTALDLDDAEAIKAFLAEQGGTPRGFTQSAWADNVISFIADAPTEDKRRMIADAIDGLQEEDVQFAEPFAKALLALSKQLPAPKAEDVIAEATVEPALPLLELIRRATGQRPAAERSAETQAWVDHFLSLPRNLEGEQARREAVADEAWQRVQEATRIESMMEAPERQPVDQAALDAAASSLDRAIMALSSRTPTSREKLQKLRDRAQLLLEETVDGYNRRVGERPDASGSGAGADAGGGAGPGGGGVGFVTRGGRSSTASAITPLQYKYLNTVGGRRDVGTSVGERSIAANLGVAPEEVVPIIMEALAQGIALDITERGAERGIETAIRRPSSGILGTNLTPSRTQGYNDPTADAAAIRELLSRQRRPTANVARRRLGRGELVPTVDRVAPLRGPVAPWADPQETAGEPGGGVYPGAAAQGTDQGRGLRRGSRDAGAVNQGNAAAQPDDTQRDTGVPRLSLAARTTPEAGVVPGVQYPQDEVLQPTRGRADLDTKPTTYKERLRSRSSIETLTTEPSDAELEAIAKKEAAAEKRAKNKLKKGRREVDPVMKKALDELQRVADEERGGTVKPEDRIDALKRAYEKQYPAREYDEDVSEIIEIRRDVDSRSDSTRGLTPEQVAAMSGSPEQVLTYLQSVMRSPLARIVAGQIKALGLELPPITWGPIANNTPGSNVPVLGRYRTSVMRGVVTGDVRGVSHAILIDPDRADLETILHEFIHAATLRLLENPETIEHAQVRAQLQTLMEFVQEQSPEAATQYGFTNVKEFVAEALSNPEFQQVLAKTPLPYAPRVSVLDAIKNLILRMFGVATKDNVLAEVYGLSKKVMSGKQTTIEDEANAQGAAAPSTSIVGTMNGQRAFIAYASRDGKSYTLYPVTAAEPRGVKGAGIPKLTRAQAEQQIKAAGGEVLAPIADARPDKGTPKNTATKLVGFNAQGVLQAAAFEQKNGTWTYYESNGDVRSDPDARVIKGISKNAAERYITAKGLGPTPPKAAAVRPNSAQPTPLGYNPASWLRYQIQDVESALKNMGEAQRRDGTPADQRIDIKAAERNNRVRLLLKKYMRQYVDPARKSGEAISQRFGKSQAEIETIVQNLHIVERMDKKIRQVQQGNMSPQEMSAAINKMVAKQRAAEAVLRAANGSNPALVAAIKSDLSPKLKALSDNTIDLQAQYGLISRDAAEQIKAAYDYYVPLQVGDRTTTGKASTGQNVDTDNSFARMADQLASTISRGEMNRIRQEVLKLVEGRGLKNLEDPGTPPVVVGPSVRVYWDPATNSLNVGQNSHVFDENSMDVFVQGNRVRITIADSSLLEALHPFKNEERRTAMAALLSLWARLKSIAGIGQPVAGSGFKDLADVGLGAWRGATHTVAIGKTALSPMFGPFNFIRDIGTSMINMPPGVSRVRHAMQLMNPETYYNTFMNVGRDMLGQDTTGRFHDAEVFNSFISQRAYLGLDQMVNNIETMFSPSIFQTVKGKRENIFKFLTFSSQFFESLTRYAAYKAGVASGLTPKEAGYAAKTASVNFENRGLKNLSGYWIFGNAKMQGIQALVSTMERAGLGRSAAFTVSLVALGMLAASVGYDKSEKDKDGKSKYTKIPDYKKDSMVLFKEGAAGVPIPQEVAPFYVLGNALQEYRMGGTTGGKMASRVFTSIINNAWPGNVPQQDVTGHKAHPVEFVIRATLPSNVLPAIDLATNHTTFGSQVVPDKEDRLKRGIPLRDMGSANENQLAVNVAKGLGAAGVDIAPQQVRLVNNYYNPAAEGYAFWRDLLGGREEKYIGDVVNPFVRKFTGQATQFYDQDQFDELLAQATQAEYLAKKDGIDALPPEQQALARSASMLKKVESDGRALFKNAQTLSPERRKMLNERRQELLLTGIRRYNELRDRTAR